MRTLRSLPLIAVAVLALIGCVGCDDFDFFRLLDGADDPEPEPPALALSMNEVTLLADGSCGFSARGGVPPYVFHVSEGAGRIDESSGLYIAPSTPGRDTVRVTDSRGANDDAVVTVIERIRFTIYPASAVIGSGSTITFGAFAGVPPYTFSIGSGTGTIDGASGVYTAPADSGEDTIQVEDSVGNEAEATVSIESSLELTIYPASAVVGVDSTVTFGAFGGVPPYTFSIGAGTGSIDGASGVYSAPSVAGVDTIRVEDSEGSADEATVSIVSGLEFTISPSEIEMYVDRSVDFDALGGVEPYTFMLLSGSGSVDGATGVYVAPAEPSADVVRVTDALGATSDATVSVASIQEVTISPREIGMYVNTSVDFNAVGGVGPYSFTVVSGSGSVDETTGLYVAASEASVDVVRVTDGLGATSDATVTVHARFNISPANVSLTSGSSFTFSAYGGLPPYSFSLEDGTGTVDPSTGVYVAPAEPDEAVIEARDALGNTGSAAVVVEAPSPLVISPASVTLNVDGGAVFSATGGQPPYSFSVQPGLAGAVGEASGVYTAPGAPDYGVVRVTDSGSPPTTSDAEVTVVAAGPLAISPASATVSQTESLTFSASGGTTPYVYSVSSGGGTVITSTGAYGAPEALGAAVVKVTDSLGAIAEADVTIAPLSPSSLNASGGRRLIRLTWIDRAVGETGFSIERRSKWSTVFTQLATVGPNVNTYDDRSVSRNVVYTYRVRAYAGTVYSAYSNESFAASN